MTKLRALALGLPLFCLVTPAFAEVVRGTGHAPITKDVASVHNQALASAKQALVVQMLANSIGQDRAGEVPPATIAALADQIRDDMLTNQTSERDKQTFSLTLEADIDGAWFRRQLDNYQIQSSSQRADGDRQLIFVMLDEDDGMASDFSTPAETHVAYDRSNGGSFSDRSSVIANSRDAAASTSRSASAYNASGSSTYRASAAGAYRQDDAAAYGENGPYGSAAGRARSSAAGGFSGSAAGASSQRAAGASSASSASASSHSANYADRTNVQAEVHDNVRYRQDIVYQRPAEHSDGDAIMNGLKGKLIGYGVSTADSWAALSTYFANQPPRYAALKRDVRFQPFLKSLKARNATFFMGGTFSVTHEGVDPATGKQRCSGKLTADVSATDDGGTIASTTVNASAAADSPEACGDRLGTTLAGLAATDMGPDIQNHWRAVARTASAMGQDTRQQADYALVLRSAHLDMAMQADLLDALQATPGVQSQNFVSQAANEMRFTVRYAGSVPLQLALFQELRSNPVFAGMQSTADGRSVLLCLSGCGPAQ
jgi:hypothetical protein